MRKDNIRKYILPNIPYTVSPSVLTDGVSEVTITYTEERVTKTASTPVTVEKVLTAIEVTTPPTKTSYNYLESFDPAGMVVTAKFSDGSSAPATGYTYPDTAFSTLGSQPVNIGYTYEGVSRETTLSVTVNAISVPIPTQDGTISYTGLEQTLTWNNFDSVKMAVTGDTSGVNAKDNYSVTFTWDTSYESAKMTVSVEAKTLAGTDYPAEFTPTPNYQWWDGTTDTKSATWSIARATIATVPSQNGTLTYNGSEQTGLAEELRQRPAHFGRHHQGYERRGVQCQRHSHCQLSVG